MQRLIAISWLTIKAAVRYRLVWVLGFILLGGVVLLPLVIRDDGTARGFTQILLTYTLSFTTAILGLATLWLACGALARDIEECQMQVVATKPVHRWEIWLGKYLGILAVNAALLVLVGTALFFLLQWRAGRLPAEQQEVLRNEIFVARAAVRAPMPEINGVAEEILQNRLAQTQIEVGDLELLRNQIRGQVKAAHESIPPEMGKIWEVNMSRLKDRLKDRPLYARVKFNTPLTAETKPLRTVWRVGDETIRESVQREMSFAPDSFHEFQIPPNMIDSRGVLTVRFINWTDTLFLFPLEDGFEILYREGGFALNFSRGLVIIFCWLAFLAAIGLAASSFLSFPVAAFVACGVLVLGFSTGTLRQVIEQGTIGEVNHETGVADAPALIDYVALPVYKGVLAAINLVKDFSPVDALSTGRSITWLQLGRAVLQIVVLMGGIFAAIGIRAFAGRELAATQGAT